MSNVGVSEAQFETAPGRDVAQVAVGEAQFSAGASGTAQIGIAEAGLLVGGSQALIPMWRLDQDGEWVPLTGDVFMLRGGKWVQL